MPPEESRGPATAPADEPAAAPAAKLPAWKRLLGPLRAAAGPRKGAVLALIVGTLIAAGAVGLWRVRGSRAKSDQAPTLSLAMILKALDEGHDIEARQWAERLQDHATHKADAKKEAKTEQPAEKKSDKKSEQEAAEGNKSAKSEEKKDEKAAAKPDLVMPEKVTAEDLAGIAFVRGLTTAHEADAASESEKKRLYLLAARFLDAARQQQFPAGREAVGLMQLGRSMYYAGLLADSRPILEQALKADPRRGGEIHYLLAETYLHDVEPAPAKAWDENVRALADGSLPAEMRPAARLQAAEILLAQNKTAECAAVLNEFPRRHKLTPEVTLLRGRVLLQQARAAKTADAAPSAALYEEAIKTLRTAQSQDGSATRVLGKAMYLIGMCLLESGDAQAALNQFARTRKTMSNTPEALAAAIEEADLLRQQGESAAANDAYCRLLDTVTEVDNFNNPWVSLDRLRRRTAALCQQYIEARDYAACAKLAPHIATLFPRDQAMELLAKTYRDWGRWLLDDAERLPAAEAQAKRREGRARFRQAGQSYAELARLRITTRRYPEEIWNSAQASFDGRDFRNTALMLEEYMKHDTRRRHAVALALLGESLLNLGRLDEALKALDQCMTQYARDTAAVRARLAASRAWLEKGDRRKAEALLKDNLDSELLTPASLEWRDSLFDLGRLLHGEQRFEEAILRLEEAVERYPDWAPAAEARYLAGDAYRQLARSIEQGLSQVLVEATRILRIKHIEQSHQAALAHFQKLRDQLMRRQEKSALSPAERTMLRNCYFAVGEMLFRLSRYDEAIKSYEAAVQRYDNTPEALEAYVQIANSYRRLERPADARSAIEQAKLLLARLKPDAHFLETTNDTREQWQEKLERLSKG